MSLQIVEWSRLMEDPVPPAILPGGSTDSAESAMTIGVFDGVHVGHRELLERIVRRGPVPTVVTFRENPKKHLSPENYGGDIFSFGQKLAVFERFGVVRVILIDFFENFSKLAGREFIELLENRGRMSYLAVGSNFRCGYRRDTDAETIREMNEKKGIPTELIPPVETEAGPVSSSQLRSAIVAGDIRLASSLAGRNIELDLSDLEPVSAVRERQDGFVYDLRLVNRVGPAAGRYPVLVNPGAFESRAVMESGKVFLPVARNGGRAEGIEFLLN